jgi:hypothetical protein
MNIVVSKEVNMWYRVSLVAETRRLPEKELVEFAEQNTVKYNISKSVSGEPMVNTDVLDNFVRDFRKQSK